MQTLKAYKICEELPWELIRGNPLFADGYPYECAKEAENCRYCSVESLGKLRIYVCNKGGIHPLQRKYI